MDRTVAKARRRLFKATLRARRRLFQATILARRRLVQATTVARRRLLQAKEKYAPTVLFFEASHVHRPRLDALIARAAPWETRLLRRVLALEAPPHFRAFPPADVYAASSLLKKGLTRFALVHVLSLLPLDVLVLAQGGVAGRLAKLVDLLVFNWVFLARANSVIQTIDRRKEKAQSRKMMVFLWEGFQLLLFLRILLLLA